MRLQTSLEYILILAAVASMAVAVMGAYNGFAVRQKASIYGLIGNETGSRQLNGSAAPAGYPAYLYAQMPSLIYLNRSSSLYLVFSLPGGSSISYAEAESPAWVSVLPGAYRNVSGSVGLLSFSVIPRAQGQFAIHLLVQLAGINSTFRNITVQGYSALPAQLNASEPPATLSASIVRHNESVLFGVSMPNQTLYATEWSHCIETNFWGNPLPTGQQCGGAQWEYFQWSTSCDQGAWLDTVTYCVELLGTNTSVSTIGQSQSYSYNITLGLHGGGLNLSSNLSSTRNSSPLMSGGLAYGNATVHGQPVGDAPQPYYDLVVLNTPGGLRAANQSGYYAYRQALDSFVSTMDYYNGSSPADPSPIQTAMGAFNLASRQLSDSPQAGLQGCGMVRLNGSVSYACRPFSPLVYGNITAYVHGGLAAGNQSLFVDGSAINVK